MEQNEMSKDYLIALLMSIKEVAVKNENAETAQFIDTILEELRKK